MRVYFKSGNKIRVSQRIANELNEMIIANNKKNILSTYFKIGNNLVSMFNIDEIEAIK